MKKNFKVLMLFIMCALICGCDYKMTINLDEKIVNFKQEIITDKEKFTDLKTKFFDYLGPSAPISTDDIYFETSDKKGIKESIQYNLDTAYIYIPNIDECYPNSSVLINQTTFYISTPGTFSCYEKYQDLDNVNIYVKTKYKVVKNNADEVKGNTYIWNINKDNYTNKPIVFEVDLTNKKFSITDYIVPIIGLCAIILVFTAIVLTKNKKEKNNQI